MTKVHGRQSRLEVTTVKRDLGVLVYDNLSVKVQVEATAANVNSMLGRLRKAFPSQDFKLWRTLSLTYIRHHLEFAVQAWSPHLKGDIAILERVQHRATKTITSIKHFIVFLFRFIVIKVTRLV